VRLVGSTGVRADTPDARPSEVTVRTIATRIGRQIRIVELHAVGPADISGRCT
jgi:hypothetical protein